MDWEASDQDGSPGVPDPDPDDDLRHLLVLTGWIMIVGGLIWIWMVFFTKQAEIGLWIAAAVCGLGFLLQRAGSQAP